MAPFFILSGIGGELADRYDKAWVAEKLKRAEIPIALVAALGFFLHSVPLLFLALVPFGIIAALFGPIKYGILPAQLEAREIPAGNALHRRRHVPGHPDRHHLGRHRAVGNGASCSLPALFVVLAIAAAGVTAARHSQDGAAAPGLAIDRNPGRRP